MIDVESFESAESGRPPPDVARGLSLKPNDVLSLARGESTEMFDRAEPGRGDSALDVRERCSGKCSEGLVPVRAFRGRGLFHSRSRSRLRSCSNSFIFSASENR